MMKAKARQADPAGGLPLRSRRSNWRTLGGLAAATVLFAATAFFCWQAWLVFAQQSAIDGSDAASKQATTTVATQIRAMHERIQTAMASAALATALSSDPPDLDQATVIMRGAVPELDAAEFYAADLRALISGDLASLGYARASLLARAQSDNKETLVLLRRVDGKPTLMQAWPARDNQGIVRGFALLRWPAQPLKDAFASVQTTTRLELRQSSGDGEPELVQATGPESTAASGDAGSPVAGSQLHVVKVPPQLPIVLPPEPLLLIGLAVLSLLGALAALWVRHVGGRRAIQVLLKKPGKVVEADQTVTNLVENKVISGLGVRTRPSPSPEQFPEPLPEQSEEIVVSPHIFRTYDIRGVVGRDLSASVAQLLGHAIGSEAKERGLLEIVVGRDGRLSGPELSDALSAGIRASGVHVIDIGLAPTPLVYFAGFHLNTGSGVAVTGSHNPPDYNGFKIVLGGETLFGDAITALYTRIVERRFSQGSGGLQVMDVAPAYIERVASDVQVQRRLKVVINAGNGVAGALAPQVLEEIGCDVIPLFCEVDGTFPNHHPDPSDPKNLKDLMAMVRSSHADVGLAFDGDGDRLGVVTQSGEVIFPDRLLMLFAADVLARNPGSTIIYDVKCTGKLGPEVARHGGLPLMWKTGHSLIKAKMLETGAQLAGEMSGHFFFKERWYGFDDGIYAAARLLEILSNDERTAQQVFDTLHRGVSTPELNVAMKEGETHRFVEEFRKRARFDGARLTTIDGVRADWPDGWGLVRASNTTPVLVLRFDADDNAALVRIQDQFRRQLLALSPRMQLPF